MSLVDLDVRKISEPHNCKDFLTVGRKGGGGDFKSRCSKCMLTFHTLLEPGTRNNVVRSLQAISFRREAAPRRKKFQSIYSSSVLYMIGFCEGMGFF